MGTREVECEVTDITVYDCDGKEAGAAVLWTSKEVPGWTVRAEEKIGAVKRTTECMDFRVIR